jgi:hypothetical protein
MQHTQRRAVLIALLAGVAGTIQYHAQQFFSGFDRFFGDRGDVRGFIYFCEHWYQSILGKASLLSPGIFYPVKGTLAYSDLMVGFAVPYAFFRALGFEIFTSVELTIIVVTFLSYCTAFLLLYRTLDFGLIPSCAGAMFFAFSSPKFNQLTHLQLQYVLLLPLIFLFVILFAKQVETISQKKAAVLLSLAACCLNLQLATTFYYGWFFVLWTILFLLLALVLRGSRRFIFNTVRKFWQALIAGALVFLLGFIPMILVYLPTLRTTPWYLWEFVSGLIPVWRAFLSMGDGNYVWGRFHQWLMPHPRPPAWGELMVGIGLIPTLAWITLTVAALWFIKSGRRETAARAVPSPRDVGLLFLGVLILATGIFFLLAFKYADHSPWHYIYGYFPGAKAIRAVSRYVIFLTLPMTIAFAYGLKKALEFAQRKRLLTVAVLLIAAFGVFEQFGFPILNGAGFSVRVEEAFLKAMAAKVANDCTAFYVALGPHPNHKTEEYQYDGMLISTFSGVKTLNASSSQFPRDWNFYFIKNPDYEAAVKQWIDSQKISGNVCRVEIDPEVEAFDPKTPSPIDDPEFFVRQLYRDFADKEPDVAEINSQVEKIRNCKVGDETCERAHVALRIFLSTGFHERGFFILRMYQARFGRMPSYKEFTEAMRRFNEKDPMVTEFADSDELVRTMGNRSFVLLHYFGYLRRDPEPSVVEGWQQTLDRSGDAAAVTEGFINSLEYRQRFRER